MKILIADDQAYIRNIVGKELRGQGHEVFTGTDGEQAIQLYEEHRPHLILVDHHMPLKTGLEVLTYIRLDKKDNIPAIIMSSNEEESVIVESFQIGVDDYIEKPVGIREVVARIQRLLTKTYGISSSPPATSSAVSPGDPLQSGRVLQKKYVGLVIPCYNEAKRLSGQVFTDFGYSNLGYHLCFVNDGSKDNTLEVLQQLREGHEDYISIYNMPVNAGKAEAVRQASLEMLKEPQLEYIGYLDADLSTDFNDYDVLTKTLLSSDYKLVSGSRISRVGADITRAGARQLISKVINKCIRLILGMNFQDTQCGAKVMSRDAAELVFREPFITRWLFDVEIFLRMKKNYGREEVKQLIYEQPLKRWIHADGSKLSMKDSAKIVGQLTKIWAHYRNYPAKSKYHQNASSTE